MNYHIKRRFYSLSTARVPMRLQEIYGRDGTKCDRRHGLFNSYAAQFLFFLLIFEFSLHFLLLILWKNFFFVLETDYIQDSTLIKWSYLFIMMMMTTIELCPSFYFSFIFFRSLSTNAFAQPEKSGNFSMMHYADTKIMFVGKTISEKK